MTTADIQRSILLVEGKDDESALFQLLRKHDLGYGETPPPPPLSIPRRVGGMKGVLGAIALSVRSGTGRSVGFVLDANNKLVDRWKAVAFRLSQVGVVAPDRIPEHGFVGESSDYGTRVGVWLMPDNRDMGALEDFLTSLVSAGDSLLAHARTATDQAAALGAEFQAAHTQKAVIHAWLAWQREPGLRYGTAIRAKYFRHNAPVATTFVAWFRDLYEVA